ncbi:MAG: 6,7-dimethyl-8-ribityllumazine synthase [Phycisphaerae bacterium]|nr:6,7-dimethyl-8-ribityllumazine synthase [Phycisphaerae bacterium]
MQVPVPLQPNARGVRVAVVVSRYHDRIVGRLADGAAKVFFENGGQEQDFLRIDAPGAFELPVVAACLLRRDDVDAVVAVGLVLTGETTHDRHISESVAHALQEIALETGKPTAFGVLTCQTLLQAEARAGGAKGNKGEEAMAAALIACGALRALDALATRKAVR